MVLTTSYEIVRICLTARSRRYQRERQYRLNSNVRSVPISCGFIYRRAPAHRRIPYIPSVKKTRRRCHPSSAWDCCPGSYDKPSSGKIILARKRPNRSQEKRRAFREGPIDRPNGSLNLAHISNGSTHRSKQSSSESFYKFPSTSLISIYHL